MASDNNSQSPLRQPEFNSLSSFSNAEKFIDDIHQAVGQASSAEEDTAKLIQQLPEGIDDDAVDSKLHQTSREATSTNQLSGHWSDNSEVLPALRQPDVNAVPPEVLAALLKSENYGNCSSLVSEAQSLGSENKSDAGAERTKTGVSPDNSKVPNPNANTTFSFSPEAKEFVPSGVGGKVNAIPSGVEGLTSGVSSMSFNSNSQGLEGLQDYPHDQPYFDLSSQTPEVVSAYLLDIVNQSVDHLKQNPAEFDYIVKETIEMLSCYLNDAKTKTLESIAALIITESIATANFAYTGARLCSEFVRGSLEAEGISFKNILLSKCQAKFNEIIEGLKKDVVPTDAFGFTRFFGELYMNLTVVKNGIAEPMYVIGLATVELLDYLIQTKTGEENIKFVSQVLKLVGWQLDHTMDPANKIKEFLDKIFSKLDTLKQSQSTSAVSIAIVDNLFKLRQRDWDHTTDEPASAALPIDTNPIYELPEEFDDDWDEDEFDDDGLYLDDESDEVQAAYEAFLQGMQK